MSKQAELYNRVQRLNKRLAGGPFNAMLGTMGLDWPNLKAFCKVFATNLIRLRMKVVSPPQVQQAAREAAQAVGASGSRKFNVMALQLGRMVADSWDEASALSGSANSGAGFIEGFQVSLRQKAPMTDNDWTQALEDGLGYAGL